MARIRTIKPEFFRHEELYEAEIKHKLPLRLAFAGLWTVADRDGRFKWKPRSIKLDCLPYDDCDFDAVLNALTESGFVIRYSVDGEEYGCIPGWDRHQVINLREAKSNIPAFTVHGNACARTCNEMNRAVTVHGDAPANDMTVHGGAHGEGKGREGKVLGDSPPTAPAKKGSRLPKDWKPSDELCNWALEARPDLDNDCTVESFVDYWVAKPGKDGLKLDWDATYRNWVKNQRAGYANSNRGSTPGGAFAGGI